MRALLEALREKLREGEDTVLVTLAASAGSTPREAGASMLTGRGGRIQGTVGGGVVEHLAEEEALGLLRTKGRSLKKYLLHPDEAADLGARCGGELSLSLRFLDGKDPSLARLVEAALESFLAPGPSWLIMETGEGRGPGILCLAGEEGPLAAAGGDGAEVPVEALREAQALLAEEGGRTWLSLPLAGKGLVYVFGGGHVAQELVPLLAHLGFRCAVFDDREEFTKRELFPQAERIICGDYGDIGKTLNLRKEDYVVIVTRGHAFDFQAEAFALSTEAGYIGVIGSRTKLAFVSERLKNEEGFKPEEIAAPRVHAPIGLPIKSKTPAEIAVSIAAELILERGKKINNG
jgi:xanthine dehydrogenase accessory factor